MTDFDHASLDRILPPTPGPGDWDDVLSRSGVTKARRPRLLFVLAVFDRGRTNISVARFRLMETEKSLL